MTARLARAAVTLAGILALWQIVVWASGVPPYILPGPAAVARAWQGAAAAISHHAAITLTEILLGLALGTLLGVASALFIVHVRPARRWLMPVLVASQAIPVFAVAPLLVLWFGYGLASKVVMATLIIYFPIATNFLDGLRRTDRGWLDIAHTMTAGHPRARWAVLRHVRIPAALPSLASGLRIATAVAPIGAIIGEWVGSSAGLGYLMLHANGRMQIDLLFAALFTLAGMSVLLFALMDRVLRRALPWQVESSPEGEPEAI